MCAYALVLFVLAMGLKKIIAKDSAEKKKLITLEVEIIVKHQRRVRVVDLECQCNWTGQRATSHRQFPY